MNLTETARVLTLAAEYDRLGQQVTETTVRAWQSVLADVTVQEAADAVTAHYQHSTWPVKVADIRDRVKLARRATAEAAYQDRARAEVTPGDPYPVQAGVAHVVRALAEHQGRDPIQADVDLQARRRALSVPCPWCNAVAWDPCVIPGVMDAKGSPQQLRAVAHPSRVEAAS